jgi:hypothetical protein
MHNVCFHEYTSKGGKEPWVSEFLNQNKDGYCYHITMTPKSVDEFPVVSGVVQDLIQQVVDQDGP